MKLLKIFFKDDKIESLKLKIDLMDQAYSASNDDYSEESYDAQNYNEKLDETEFKKNKNKFYYYLNLVLKSKI